MIIQHLKNLYLKCQVHPVTLIYLIFAWLGGYLKWYLSALALVCIHEICHLVMAYYFHFQIDKIEILPFGAYLNLQDFYFHPFSHELCVVLAGPCCHLFLFFFIKYYIHGVYQQYLLTMNLLTFLFNLMPVYPLDGSRIIGLLLQSVMDLKKALYFHLKLSVLALCILIVFYLQISTFIIMSYLLFQQFYYRQFIPRYLRKFYMRIPTFSPRKRIIIHHDLAYRRNCMNFYDIDGYIVNEKEMMFALLKSIK